MTATGHEQIFTMISYPVHACEGIIE